MCADIVLQGGLKPLPLVYSGFTNNQPLCMHEKIFDWFCVRVGRKDAFEEDFARILNTSTASIHYEIFKGVGDN